jgi:hypothetical protein
LKEDVNENRGLHLLREITQRTKGKKSSPTRGESFPDMKSLRNQEEVLAVNQTPLPAALVEGSCGLRRRRLPALGEGSCRVGWEDVSLATRKLGLAHIDRY